MANQFQAIHLKHDIPDLSSTFKITTSPGTDVWDKPPSIHSFDAPIIYRSTKISAFRSAKVTISSKWTHKYDQGGLCLIAMLADGRKWIKTGIEFENDQPNVSTVAKDTWSDWSLIPLESNEGTVEMKVEGGSLWVWLVEGNVKRTPLREVTFWADLPQDAECWVGVYVAKPAPHGETEELTVEFKDLEIDIS